MLKRKLSIIYFILLLLSIVARINAQPNLIYTKGYNDFRNTTKWAGQYAYFSPIDSLTLTTNSGWINFHFYSNGSFTGIMDAGIEYKFKITLDPSSPAIDFWAFKWDDIYTRNFIHHLVPGYNEFTYTANASYSEDIAFKDILGSAATYKFTQLYMTDQMTVPINLYHPDGGQAYFYGDTVNVTYQNELYGGNDSVKVYYSTDAGSSWIYIGQDTASGSYNWIAPAIKTTLARILITTKDSSSADNSNSSFFILPKIKTLTILKPTTTVQNVSNDNMLIQVESINTSSFKLYYSINDTINFSLISDNVGVNPGDGIAPDTTNYYWNVSGINLTGTITLKALTSADSLFTGSITDPYYGVGSYQFVGYRGAATYAQSVNQWSSMYLVDDNLYTISFFGYVWGWYDFSDRIDLWKWNTVTNRFEIVATNPTPAAAYYPKILLYRSSPYTFVMWNAETGLSGYYKSTYKTATITYPNTISDWSSNTVNIAPTNIDVGNTVINYNGWRYTLNQSTRKITAVDLYNPGNNILVTDASVGGIIGENNVDFFVYDSLIILSRKYWQSEFGNAAVWIVGNAFPVNVQAASDQVSFVLQGTMRNYFRGVYPNAIIRYYPPIR